MDWEVEQWWDGKLDSLIAEEMLRSRMVSANGSKAPTDPFWDWYRRGLVVSGRGCMDELVGTDLLFRTIPIELNSPLGWRFWVIAKLIKRRFKHRRRRLESFGSLLRLEYVNELRRMPNHWLVLDGQNGRYAMYKSEIDILKKWLREFFPARFQGESQSGHTTLLNDFDNFEMLDPLYEWYRMVSDPQELPDTSQISPQAKEFVATSVPPELSLLTTETQQLANHSFDPDMDAFLGNSVDRCEVRDCEPISYLLGDTVSDVLLLEASFLIMKAIEPDIVANPQPHAPGNNALPLPAGRTTNTTAVATSPNNVHGEFVPILPKPGDGVAAKPCVWVRGPIKRRPRGLEYKKRSKDVPAKKRPNGLTYKKRPKRSEGSLLSIPTDHRS
eukprot:scaffold15510_cov213-Amphora_coffeaeformis.AAC.3